MTIKYIYFLKQLVIYQVNLYKFYKCGEEPVFAESSIPNALS